MTYFILLSKVPDHPVYSGHLQQLVDLQLTKFFHVNWHTVVCQPGEAGGVQPEHFITPRQTARAFSLVSHTLQSQTVSRNPHFSLTYYFHGDGLKSIP